MGPSLVEVIAKVFSAIAKQFWRQSGARPDSLNFSAKPSTVPFRTGSEQQTSRLTLRRSNRAGSSSAHAFTRWPSAKLGSHTWVPPTLASQSRSRRGFLTHSNGDSMWTGTRVTNGMRMQAISPMSW